MSRIPESKWLLLTALALIWGSSFILMKKGLVVYTPGQVAGIRMTVAAAASLLLASKRLRKLDFSKVRYMAVVGLVGSGIPAFLFATAQTRISSYLAGMLNALTPVFTLLIGSLFFHSRFKGWQVLGVMIGFVGAAGLIFVRANGGLNTESAFAALIVIATCCYGISVNTIKTFLAEQDSLVISTVALCIVGIPYAAYLFSTDFLHRLTNIPGASQAFVSLVLLSVFGTAISNVLYFRLVKVAGPLFASAVTYLMPVIALGWGLADGEKLHPLHLPAMMLILAGVGLISYAGQVPFFGKKAN